MRRGISIVVLVGVVAVFLIAVSWVGFSRGGNIDGGRVFAGELYTVTEGSFGVTVPTSGELAAKEQINIHNLLESDAVIIGPCERRFACF